MLKKEMMKLCEVYRPSLRPDWEELNSKETPRGLELERPEFFKQYQSDVVVELETEVNKLEKHSMMETIQLRRSVRQYSDKAITFEELSYLLINTCKTTKISEDHALCMGVTPTPGAIKSLDTYLYIDNVEGLEKGIYHYNVVDSKLYLLKIEVLIEDLHKAIRNQAKGAQVYFFWTTSPKRTEYKYTFTAHKMIAMEAGHICQNLYLSATSLDLGAVAIGAYSQELSDILLDVDGEKEFTIYVAAVGNKLEVE